MSSRGLAIVVAIPARNEAALLPRCIAAIEAQVGVDRASVGIFVAANNCTDATAELAAGLAASSDLALDWHSFTLPDGRANAGWARRLAMEGAAAMAAPDAMLVSTDADAIADADWLATLRAALTPGVAAVAGRVSGDWEELRHLPARALATGDLEWRYHAAAAELEWLIDPVPEDPWPRHRQESGANLAVRHADWLQAGGVPPMPCGEDRAFVRAVMRSGRTVRHAPEPHVTVSGRQDGRATGGMASAIAARAAGLVAIDTNIETADRLVDRLTSRARLRRMFAHGCIGPALAALGLPPELANAPNFALLWEQVEPLLPAASGAMDLQGLAAEVALLERHLDRARRPAEARTIHA